MKAYVLMKPSEIVTEDREIPSVGYDEVLIRIHRVGICGSDIHLYKGTYSGPHSYPMLFGHEWAGIVENIGAGVSDLKPGDAVTGDCSKFCGSCEMCKSDKNLCSVIEKYGITVDGASAQYIVRPRKHVYKGDTNTDLELLALTEPIAVAKHLIRRIIKSAGNLKTKKILIYGGGAIGQAALMLLIYLYGCRNVELTDLVEQRLALAKILGGKIPDPGELNVSENSENYASLYKLAKYDVVIETTGVATVFANALHLIKPDGILGCVGMIDTAQIEQKLIVTKALTIIGSIGGTGEFPEVMAFVNNHKELARKLISHRFSAEQCPQAFQAAMDVNSAMKVMIEI